MTVRDPCPGGGGPSALPWAALSGDPDRVSTPVTTVTTSAPVRSVQAGSRLSLALAVVTTAACLVTLLVPDLLGGTAVMNGSAKGTALVALVLAVPLLVASHRRARTGSTHSLVVHTGAAAYLLYNAMLLTYATPFNQAFVLYVAMLALAAWTTLSSSLVLAGRVDHVVGEVPRWVAVFMWTVVGLNTAAWLTRVIPPVFDEDPTAWLDGTGLTTNPVIAQDLAFWLPLLGWLGWGVWAARPPVVALAAAGLVFWIVEGVGVAVDQWWGHRADPASEWASYGATVMFLVVAALTLLPTLRLLRSIPTNLGGRHEH